MPILENKNIILGLVWLREQASDIDWKTLNYPYVSSPTMKLLLGWRRHFSALTGRGA